MKFKKIVIFGGSGMVGKNLINKLDKNYNLFYPTRSQVNLFERKKVYNYLKKVKPDLVINCAAKVEGIKSNYNNNLTFYKHNLLIGLNMVLCSEELKIKNFLNLGSSCLYPTNSGREIGEDKILSGPLEVTNEGYALAKVSILKLCQYINKKKNYNYKTLMPCNLYGLHDKFDPIKSHLVPAAIIKIHLAKLKNKKYVEIWGSGKQRREFMYIEDFVNIIENCIKKFSHMPSILNIGLGKDYTINQYYKTIKKIIGYKGRFKYNLNFPSGVHQKLLDIRKMKKMNLKIKTSLSEGIKKTYNFYLNI